MAASVSIADLQIISITVLQILSVLSVLPETQVLTSELSALKKTQLFAFGLFVFLVLLLPLVFLLF